MSDLRNIINFWVMWNILKDKGVAWKKLTNYFSKEKSFSCSLNNIKNDYFGSIDLFLENTNQLSLIENKTEEIFMKMNKLKIYAISYDNFKKYNAFKNIKNAYWFFLKGDISLLNNKIDSFVSVVGSRKTPHKYSYWIDQMVPKDKIIISGLANGADCMAHENSMKYNQKIIVFPGTDIHFSPKSGIKKTIWDYSLKNGLLISDIFPGTKSFDKTSFLKRNKWMAQMVNQTYSVYFDGISGTLGQLLEVSRNKKGKVFMPKEVFEKNKAFLLNHKTFKEIIDKIEVTKWDVNQVQ